MRFKLIYFFWCPIILTGGPVGGGKSTGLQDAKIDRTNFVEGNPDIIKKQAGYTDQAEAFHEESSRIAKEILGDAYNENYHILYDSQLTSFPLADALIQDTLKKGGEAAIVFTNIDAETSITRSMARFIKGETDREVSIETSVKGYNRSLPTFLELYENYGDNPNVIFRLFDNNVDFEKTRLVFRKIGDMLEIGDQELFDRLLNTDYDKIVTKDGIRYERQEKATIVQIEKRQVQIYDRADRISHRQGHAETPLEILPESCTIQEAKYFLKFKNVDSLRKKIASLRSKERSGISPEEIQLEVSPPEESLTEAYPEEISTDFADHVEGYISDLIDLVEIVEPGKRFKIEGTRGLALAALTEKDRKEAFWQYFPYMAMQSRKKIIKDIKKAQSE